MSEEEKSREEQLKEAKEQAEEYIKACVDYGIRIVALAVDVLKIPPSILAGACKVARRIIETKSANGQYIIEKSNTFMTDQVMDLVIAGGEFEIMPVDNLGQGMQTIITAENLTKPKAQS